MEEQNSVRGQGFTLMIFGGLVALCAVFFILGMVVGRGQGSQAAAGDPAPLAAALPAAEDDAGLDFYEAVTRDELPPLEETGPPASEAGPAEARQPLPAQTAPAPGSEAVMLQLGAFRVEQTALGLATEVRERGFFSIVLRPAPGDESGLYRVQVGPLASSEAVRVRSQLETAGYDVVTVR